MNKEFGLQRIKCVRWRVFVFVFHTTERRNIVLEKTLREIFGMYTEGETEVLNKIAQ